MVQACNVAGDGAFRHPDHLGEPCPGRPGQSVAVGAVHDGHCEPDHPLLSVGAQEDKAGGLLDALNPSRGPFDPLKSVSDRGSDQERVGLVLTVRAPETHFRCDTRASFMLWKWQRHCCCGYDESNLVMPRL